MSSDLGACFLCQCTDGGPLSHICAECKVEICPTCVASKQLSACPACGDKEQNWKALQKFGSFVVAYGTARDWLRGVGSDNGSPKAAQAVDSIGSSRIPSPASQGCKSPKGRTSKDELPPAVVGEVLDWLKEEVDGSWLDDCVAGVADTESPEVLELVDAGKKCTSVIGANGDYRSGMAREAVAYLLKNSMAANKAKEKKMLPKLPISNSNNSTAAPSTVGSACPTLRSEKPEASACPTLRSEKPEASTYPKQAEKPEEPLESWRTVQPSEGDSSEPTWHTSTPTSHSQPHSPAQVHGPTQYNKVENHVETSNMVTAETKNDTAASTAPTWSLAAFTKGFENLSLPMVPSWSTTVNHCSKMNIAHREVMEHGYLSEPSPAPPEMIQKPVDDLQNGDDWAEGHFAALENVAQGLKSGVTCNEAASAIGDDECRSYVTSVICPPVVPPLVFPTSGQHQSAVASRTETLQTTSSKSTTTCNTAASELEVKGKCEETPCMGNGTEDTCPKGHDRRWHGWHCGVCNKRGNGLRFGCMECLDANLCFTCKKTHEGQKQVSATLSSGMVCAEVEPAQTLSAIDETTVSQAASKNGVEIQEAKATQPKSGDRPARSSSSSRKERTGASGSKSVLSVQTMGTSSAAQLLGGLSQQQGSKPARTAGSSSKSVLSVQTMGNSSAAQLLGGLAQQQGSKPRSSSSKKAFESKSMVGAEGSTNRRSGQRAGGSVLSVKNASSSAAAGLLGPLLEQKAQH